MFMKKSNIITRLTSSKWVEQFHNFPRNYSTIPSKPTFNSPPIHQKPTTHLLKSLKNPFKMNQIVAQLMIHNQRIDRIMFMKLIDYNIYSNGSVNLFTQLHNLIDSNLCNLVLKTCTHLKKHWHSTFMFVQMHKHGILSPDSLTFPAVIKSTAHLGRPKVGKSLHCCVVKMGFDQDLFVNTALVHMYGVFSTVDDARKVFDEMPVRNSVAWNALINGYVDGGRFLEAFDVFRDMMRVGVELQEVTMVGVLSACANLGALEQGRWVHDYIQRNGLALNVYVGTALVDMYAKCACLEEACEVFGAMKVRNVCAWNVLVSAYSMNGRAEDALMAFYRMTFDGYEPDHVTLLAVLSACYHDGLVGEGIAHFRSMKEEFGLDPKMEHYGCLVDLFGRAGLVDEIIELIRTMPLEPDPIIWRALLRACQFHGKHYSVELVIRKLIELEPNSGDNFLLLLNLYVQQQRWVEIDVIKEIMKDRGIRKVPGYSSIEIKGIIYEFVASYDLEPGLKEIYEISTSIARESILSGCVADIEVS